MPYPTLLFPEAQFHKSRHFKFFHSMNCRGRKLYFRFLSVKQQFWWLLHWLTDGTSAITSQCFPSFCFSPTTSISHFTTEKAYSNLYSFVSHNPLFQAHIACLFSFFNTIEKINAFRYLWIVKFIFIDQVSIPRHVSVKVANNMSIEGEPVKVGALC